MERSAEEDVDTDPSIPICLEELEAEETEVVSVGKLELHEAVLYTKREEQNQHDQSRSSEPRTITSQASACSTNTIASSQPDLNSADDEEHKEESILYDHVIILRFSDKYLKTWPGLLRFLQAVIASVALICLCSSGAEVSGGYLHLPAAAHLRTFVFTSVCALMTSLAHLCVQITSLAEIMPLHWGLMDLIVYSVLSIAYVLSTIMVGVVLLSSKLSKYSSWTKEQLAATTVLGSVCVVLHILTACHGFMAWKGKLVRKDFRRYKFKNRTETQEEGPSNTSV